jgi:hypothetical protein
VGGTPIYRGLDFWFQVNGVSSHRDPAFRGGYGIETCVRRLGNSMDHGRFTGGVYGNWADVDSDDD